MTGVPAPAPAPASALASAPAAASAAAPAPAPAPDPGADPGLAVVLDPARLSVLVGEPVRATRVRPKPGVTHVAALVATPGGEHEPGTLRGWVRTLQGAARAKADKMRRVAAEHAGVGLGEHEGPEDLLVLWGPVEADPALAKELARLLRRTGRPGEGLRMGEVLRYNPGRRLVLRDGEVVHRLTADPHRDRLTALTRALRDVGQPVVAPLPDQPARSDHVSTWPWVEGHDAATSTGPDQLRAVGTLLRHLHEVDATDLPELPHTGWSELRSSALCSLDQLLGLVREERELAALAERARTVLATLDPGAEGSPVVSHGDFSLDQCLVADDGRLLLTDLDRAALAPRELDLATLHAAGIVDGVAGAEAVVSGYAAGPGPVEVSPAWVAAAVLARASQPWRGRGEDWVEETRRILLAALDLVAVRVPGSVGEGEDRIVVERAWPGRSADEGVTVVAVEGRDARGRLRAGTWSSDGRAAVLAPGEDRRLPALADLARTGELLVHRPGRRAVLRVDGGFAKVLRRGRGAGVAAAGATGQALAAAAGLAAPRVIEADDPDVVLLETLPGRPLHDLTGDPGWETAWTTWAGAWTRFQALPHTGFSLPTHTWADEAEVLRDWAGKAAPLLAGTTWPERIRAVADRLAAVGGVRLVPTHRDLHDKQLLWDGRTLGVLDLDTACLAPAALDPANLAVHADLRAAQGVWTEDEAAVVVARAREVARRAGVDDAQWELARLATVARLVAVYAFRPRWRDPVLTWAEPHT